MLKMRYEGNADLPDYTRLIITNDPKWDAFIHLASVGDMVHRYFAARLSNIGLTRPKFAILYQIRAGLSPVAPTFISRRMPRAKHTISQAITELENDGYIKRSINQSNRRSITLSLTKRGEEKTDEALSYARNLSREMMSCFNNTQLKDLDSYLATIRLIYLTKIKDVS